MNPYIEMLKKVQAENAEPPKTESLSDFGLGGVDCPICHNTGMLLYRKDGREYAKECECMNKRRFLKRVKASGIEDMLRRYTFDAYETPDAQRQKVKEIAEAYAEADSGWLFIAGKSGSGKTHICTAVCSRFIARGVDVYYMEWRDESRQLKALMNTEELNERLDRLKKVKVLYIDDFLKGGCNEADIRLAFEIINARYNNSKLRTIISTEASIETIIGIDEALGSRIKERSRGFICKAPKENYRLRE